MSLKIKQHDKPYPAIDPHRPEVSQKGKTVLVCGGSAGIGHAIARNFCEAKASKLIILGRRPAKLASAADALAKAYPDTIVEGRPMDVFDLAKTAELWDALHAEGLAIDVLVWNPVFIPELKPILEQGAERLWKDFEGNVHVPLVWVEKFYKQPQHTGKKHFLFVATQDIHNWDSAPQMPGYQLTKNACACTMQQIARDIPVEKMQMVSFHPSVVLTEMARNAGYTEDTLPWTSEDLPGQFAVWAASPEATFLHGRFVWCTWDVNELSSGEIRAKIDADPWYLKVGVKGL